MDLNKLPPTDENGNATQETIDWLIAHPECGLLAETEEQAELVRSTFGLPSVEVGIPGMTGVYRWNRETQDFDYHADERMLHRNHPWDAAGHG